jgi:predicted O-methyltransferase YrrM
LPKVRKGGILAGDDIIWGGVEKAVKELLSEYQTAREFFDVKHKMIWIHKK